MRNKFLKLPLAALLAGLVPAGALAAQDTLGAAPAAEAEAPLARRGDLIARGDQVVRAGEVVEGRVIVTGGTLVVEGSVTGNVTVTGGSLRVARGGEIGGSAQVTGGGLTNAGSIGGDAVVKDGKLVDDGGRFGGEMRTDNDASAGGAHGGGADASAAIRIGNRTWLGAFGDGAQGLIQTLAFGLLLAGIGAAVIFYARPQLERVSDAVRTDTLRAGGVGLAANFLWLPVYVLGTLGLIFTLVGIPFLLVWVPLFPVAVLAAAGYGVLASAHALGERTAEQGGPRDGLARNSYAYLFAGIAVLLLPLFVAHALELFGYFGWVADMVEALGMLVLWLAATVGVGGAILTRGGSRRDWGWNRRRFPYDPIFDSDPLADELEPAGAGRGL